MSNARVSYIITARNAADTILESLDSINDPNRNGLCEVVIVNDGSSDKTLELLENYSFKIPHKIVDFQAGIGRVSALNYAIGISQGEYIAILDSDDIEISPRFWRSLDFLDSHPEIDVVAGLHQKFGDWGINETPEPVPTSPLEIRNCIKRFRNPIPHSASMFRRSWFNKLGGYDSGLERCQDLDLFIRGFGDSNYFIFHSVFLHYRTNSKNPQWKYYLLQEKYRLKVILKHKLSNHAKFFSFLGNTYLIILFRFYFYLLKTRCSRQR
jgi:glycosyltransferase involved in cell wall biosynthesis